MPERYANVEIRNGFAHIDTDQYSAVVCPEGYVSGVQGGTFRDKRTGAVDLGHGLDIVDFLMQPWRHPREGELPRDQQYNLDVSVHGAIEKHFVELPQICTQAKKLPMETVTGPDFVAVKQHWDWRVATLGYEPGSRWEQVLVFPRGKRYFYATDVVTSANDAEQLLLRIDFPGHLKHAAGDTFDEIYLSYHGRIPSSEFLDNFTPDDKFTYQRPKHGAAESVIRAYKTSVGPWLAGLALDPSMIWEAWCHQRGYVCFITEIGGYPIKKGESFGAVYIIGFFDSIEEMHETYEAHRGVRRLTVCEDSYSLEC